MCSKSVKSYRCNELHSSILRRKFLCHKHLEVVASDLVPIFLMLSTSFNNQQPDTASLLLLLFVSLFAYYHPSNHSG